MLNAKGLKNYKKSLRLQLKEYKSKNMWFSLKQDLKSMLKMQSEYLGKNGSFNLDRLWFQHIGGYIRNNLHGEHEVSYFRSSLELRVYIENFFTKRGFIVREINKTHDNPFVKDKSGCRVMLRVMIPTDKI